jgi:hypothetical protein
MTEAPDEWDNRLCGRITKAGKRCRAHAELDPNGDGFETIGCYLHDARRRTHWQKREAERTRMAKRRLNAAIEPSSPQASRS